MMKHPLSRFLPALMIGLALLMTGCAMVDQLRARDQLNKGVKAYSSQHYDEAVEYFQQAIDYDPQLLNARLYLATTYRAQWVPGLHTDENADFSEKAIKTFEDVLERDPTNINAMANIAGIYGGNDDLSRPRTGTESEWKSIPITPSPFTESEPSLEACS